VDDSPPGVSREALAHLFDPLYRAEPSRNRASGGSGLGLAIARRIAQAHGGSLTASPSPLGGLRLELRLPREAS
jgi:two-component system sensor histidine kinase BaeS